MVAAELREKREIMKQQKKDQEKNARRIGYGNFKWWDFIEQATWNNIPT